MENWRGALLFAPVGDAVTTLRVNKTKKFLTVLCQDFDRGQSQQWGGSPPTPIAAMPLPFPWRGGAGGARAAGVPVPDPACDCPGAVRLASRALRVACGDGAARPPRPGRYDARMLVATWILAVATAILALSGPVALFAWLSARRQDRERQQRQRELEAEGRILQSARQEFATMEGIRKEFVSKDGARSTAGGYTALATIVGFIGYLMWRDEKKPGA